MSRLARRGEFMVELARLLPAAAGLPCSLVLLEIDGLKTVNALLGHEAGDRLVSAVSRRVKELVPEGGVGARLDGAEFSVVIPTDSVEELDATADAMRARVQEPVQLPETIHPVVCIGSAVAGSGDSVDDILGAANLALAAARESGAGYERYEPGLRSTVLARQTLELAIREAVPRGELEVYYQPVVDLRDGRVVGAEALVRWWRNPGEMVMPLDFIPAAEETGVIGAIGRCVLERACLQMAIWNDRYPLRPPLEVGVNVSVRQLASGGFAAEVIDALEQNGLDPGQITLEVTESALMDDMAAMVQRLEELKAIGLTIAMDDFGTGYSSLSYLRRLPIDVLKIDRSFVDGIARSEEEWALTVAIVNLANSLGKRTLAEGVETAAQVAHLRALGCVLAQGYLFGRPMPADQFEDLLRAGGADSEVRPARN